VVGASTDVSLIHGPRHLMMEVLLARQVRSWRDPDGFVVELDGRILRAVAPEKAGELRALLTEPWFKRFIDAGSIPATIEITDPGGEVPLAEGWVWFEHQRLRFPCYPHEITALQLYDSAELTLSIALEATRNGWTLKDASAWNVLYSEGRVVFVDLLSFERTVPTGMWRAYGQFVGHFVLPLLLYRHIGLTPPEIFLIHRDGITPVRAFESLHGVRLLSATAIEHVLLPKFLARAGSRLIAAQTVNKPRIVNVQIAAAMPIATLRRLRRTISRLRPDESKSVSVWKRYEEERLHYSQADLQAKTEFVSSHLDEGGTVLDLGCNAGEFSFLAAEKGASVVAADADHAALSRLYERIRGAKPRITPLMLNIGRPTPGIGWLNTEVDSFLGRSSGQFACVLALGLLHHLLVSERASLQMITALFRQLSPQRLIVEWVDPSDPKFKELAGFDMELYRNLRPEMLEEQLGGYFRLDSKMVLPCGTRVMYLWVRS